MLRYVDATLDHCNYVGSNLRWEDLKEIEALHGLDPSEAVRQSLHESIWAQTAMYNNIPSAVFGVTSSMQHEQLRCAIAWMLGTDTVHKWRHSLYRDSGKIIKKMYEHSRADILWNLVDHRYTASISWLEWCGFRKAREGVYMLDPCVPFTLMVHYRGIKDEI